MQRDIIVAIVSSAATALLAFAAASSLGLLEKTVSDTQLQELSTLIINDREARQVLLDNMDESKQFVGPKGDPGPVGKTGQKGASGTPGKAWNPSVRFFEMPEDKRESKVLGEYAYCGLSEVGSIHQSQACRCILSKKGGTWRLESRLDEGAHGRCVCGASCW